MRIHDARRMHLGCRLQAGDVLKPWSVRKGPSDDPGDKRLAVPLEDRPPAYEDFEGVIPKGEYGGGTVIVRDRGPYEPLSPDRRGRPVDFAESVERGHATFRLRGATLRGAYALTRFRGGADGEEARLLLRKGPGRPDAHGTPGSPAGPLGAHGTDAGPGRGRRRRAVTAGLPEGPVTR